MASANSEPYQKRVSTDHADGMNVFEPTTRTVHKEIYLRRTIEYRGAEKLVVERMTD
jgi:hypothetical protein